MSRSRTILLLASLALLPAGWHFWLADSPNTPTTTVPSHPRSSVNHSPAPAAGSAALAIVNPVSPPVDPRFPHRLSNSTKSFRELAQSPAAILLANALIDTTAPLNLPIPPSLRHAGEPGGYIIQARGDITEAFRAALTSARLEIVSYIPNNAYLVRGDARAAASLEHHPLMLAVMPFEPYYKLTGELLPLAVQGQALAAGTVLNTVLFPGTREAASQSLRQLGAEVVFEQPTPFGPQVTLRLPADALASLARLPEVEAIEIARPRKPANDLARVTVGVAPDSQAAPNYFGLTGQGVTVGVNDSGVDANHPALAGRVFGATVDGNGHGTHVAGSIAGNGAGSPLSVTPPGSTNGAIFRGMAPGAKIFSQYAFYNFFSDVDLQQQTALTNVLISNNSWNYALAYDYTFASASFDAATRDSLTGQPGAQPVLYVFSAGNDGGGNSDGKGGGADSILAPATAKNVITVGNVEQKRSITNRVEINNQTNQIWFGETDSSVEVASSSSRGNIAPGREGDFGRFKPDVVAPGEFVISCRSSGFQDPTNSGSGQLNIFNNVTIPAGSTNEFSIGVPGNATRLNIRLVPNPSSPNPMPGLPIFVNRNTNTSAINLAGFNSVLVPASGPATYYYAIGNPTIYPITFDVEVTVGTTANFGTYFVELKKLNDALGGEYRYESGTSMAAAMVSGILALMQEYFEQTLHRTNSPALMKALLINGARSLPDYDLNTRNFINYQGWGLANLTNSIPANLNGIFDQNTNDTLATGDSRTRFFTVNNPAEPLRVTLVWTDPPGNPLASLKLVNDLDLIVTNLATGQVYLGNNFDQDSDWTTPGTTITNTVGSNQVTTVALAGDSVNNVENVYIKELNSATFSVTVKARRVNVNAVTANNNSIGQDYALVVSSVSGVVLNGESYTPDPLPMVVGVTNGQVLMRQHVGANAALAATTNGIANQWNFYVFTNAPVGTNGAGTNTAFITFIPPNLSRARDSRSADIDLYVTTNPAITNLDPAAIAAADKSVKRGGNEAIIYTNAALNQVYYLGVKAEDQQAGEFGLFVYSGNTPFSQRDQNGNLIVNGINANVEVPDGMPEDPQAGVVFAIAAEPITIRRVVVTNVVTHENVGDLIGILTHETSGGEEFVVLNNHTFGSNTVPPSPVTYTFIYEDNEEGDIQGSEFTQGPGSLLDFIGDEGQGVWMLTMVDNALHHTGMVNRLTLRLEPSQDTNGLGQTYANFYLPPGGIYRDNRYVPAGVTNLAITVSVTGAGAGPVEVYVRGGAPPTRTQYDKFAVINPPGGELDVSIYDSPPLTPGVWYVMVYNPSTTTGVDVRLGMALGKDQNPTLFQLYEASGSMSLLDDSVTNSFLYVPENRIVADLMVDVRLDHPRAADLVLHLVSPSGTRILLAENRGGPLTTNYGSGYLATNFLAAQQSGNTPLPITNIITTTQTLGTLRIDYDFLTLPDDMRVYYGGQLIYRSGFISGQGTVSIDFGPGSDTNLLIVMNEIGGNLGTAWSYTPTLMSGRYYFVTFTENTNLTQTPIKFQPPPFDAALLPATNTVPAGGPATYLGPSPYLSFTNSPFNGMSFQYFYLEDFEDGSLNTPGVSVNGGIVANPSMATDSVDGDDGVIDGFGRNGHSFYSQLTLTNFTFTFNSNALGGLPTHAGVVFTDNVGGRLISFEAFDKAGNSLGVNGPFTLGVANQNTGETAEDRFLGVMYSDGLSAIKISANDNDWEIDHLQYGRIPPPSFPSSHLYVLPEESLEKFIGENSQGFWSLEIEDSLAGNITPPMELITWRLNLAFVNTNASANTLTNGLAVTNSVSGGQTVYFAVDLPIAAHFATNTLVSLGGGGTLDLLFNQLGVPDNTTPGTVVLLNNIIGSGIYVLDGLGLNTPQVIPGIRYYLGVRNNTPGTTNAFSLRVDFDLPILNPGSGPLPQAIAPNALVYYTVTLPPNAVTAAFELTSLSGDVDLLASAAPSVPIPTSYQYVSANTGTNDEQIIVTNGTVAGTWNLAVLNTTGSNVTFQIQASYTTGALSSSLYGGKILAFTSVPRLEAGGVTMTFDAVLGAHYALQASTNLQSWSTLTNFTAQSVIMSVRDPAPDPRARYYRLAPAEQ